MEQQSIKETQETSMIIVNTGVFIKRVISEKGVQFTSQNVFDCFENKENLDKYKYIGVIEKTLNRYVENGFLSVQYLTVDGIEVKAYSKASES